MKKQILAGLAAAAMLAGGIAFVTAGPASANNGASDLCDPLTTGKINTTGDPAMVPFTAPDGKLVSEYCVKAGTTAVYVTVDPPQATVTIDHPDKDSVSHYSVELIDAPMGEPPAWSPPEYPPFNPETCVEYRFEK